MADPDLIASMLKLSRINRATNAVRPVEEDYDEPFPEETQDSTPPITNGAKDSKTGGVSPASAAKDAANPTVKDSKVSVTNNGKDVPPESRPPPWRNAHRVLMGSIPTPSANSDTGSDDKSKTPAGGAAFEPFSSNGDAGDGGAGDGKTVDAADLVSQAIEEVHTLAEKTGKPLEELMKSKFQKNLATSDSLIAAGLEDQNLAARIREAREHMKSSPEVADADATHNTNLSSMSQVVSAMNRLMASFSDIQERLSTETSNTTKLSELFEDGAPEVEDAAAHPHGYPPVSDGPMAAFVHCSEKLQKIGDDLAPLLDSLTDINRRIGAWRRGYETVTTSLKGRINKYEQAIVAPAPKPQRKAAATKTTLGARTATGAPVAAATPKVELLPTNIVIPPVIRLESPPAAEGASVVADVPTPEGGVSKSTKANDVKSPADVKSKKKKGKK